MTDLGKSEMKAHSAALARKKERVGDPAKFRLRGK